MPDSETGNWSGPTRREVILLGVGAFAVAAVPGLLRRPVLVRRRVPVMGTIAEMAVVHTDRHYAHGALDAAFERLTWVERAMTRFRDDSDVGHVNQAAGMEPVPVSSATAYVLRAAIEWAESSEGAFDPCIGRVAALWDVGNRQEPPAQRSVQRLAGRRFYRNLDVDRRAGRPVVRLSERDAALDLGGIAKGYAVDLAVETLRNWGIRDGLVNVGGDLYALGASVDGDPWRVGIRSPWRPNQMLGSLAVSDRAVATSGDYLQYFDHRGTRYHHLLDPATGAPRRGNTRSVTVSADGCLTADAAATTAFSLGRQAGEGLVQTHAPDVRIERWV